MDATARGTPTNRPREICGKTHTSKAPAVVATEHHVDEHAGHNHPVKKEHGDHTDEHAGHNHAPVKVPEKHVDDHAGHNH